MVEEPIRRSPDDCWFITMEHREQGGPRDAGPRGRPPISSPTPEDQGGPPLAVLIVAAVLGLVALIAVFLAWTRPSRKAALVAVGVSIVNALLAVPAFFEPGVSSMMQTLAGVFIVWTVVAVALTLMPNRTANVTA